MRRSSTKPTGKISKDASGPILPMVPFETLADYEAWIDSTCSGDDPLFHAVIDKATGTAVGVASYLRISPPDGVIEVGHINFSPLMQRSPLSTEAMYLMMTRVFEELGYRRYEWKCDAANGPSNVAAERLGFQFEGIFRQATLYKGRNRDTAWYSILDREWPAIKAAFETWLDPGQLRRGGQAERKALGPDRARPGLAGRIIFASCSAGRNVGTGFRPKRRGKQRNRASPQIRKKGLMLNLRISSKALSPPLTTLS